MTRSAQNQYLGYPLATNGHQLNVACGNLYSKLARHVNILKQRNVSIKGRSLVANSLLLSKLWHALRIIVPELNWLDQCRRLIQKYVAPNYPTIAWSTLCLPKNKGGVSLIDIRSQHKALHMIHLQRASQEAQVSFASTLFKYLCASIRDRKD